MTTSSGNMATGPERVSQASTAPNGHAGPLGFVTRFTVLRGALPELWIIFAIKLISSAAYAVTNMTLVLWLESDLGCNDKQALAWVAAWSISMTVATLLVGSLTDALGIRRTLLLGVILCIGARTAMTFATWTWLAVAAGLLPLAVGEALAGPVLVAATRRYSTTQQRSISFSLIYVMMNSGFLIAPLIFDYARQTLGDHGRLHFFALNISTYRTLFLVSLMLEILLLPLICLLRGSVDACHGSANPIAPSPKDSEPVFKKTMNMLQTLWQQAGFYRLLVFLIFISFLKLIFMQMYYVYPTFGIRVLGPGAPIGRLWAINGILIILLVPIVGALTQKFSAYSMVIVGGLISAASVFIMAMPTRWFASLANGAAGHVVGHWYLGLRGPVHPYYVMIAFFVILLSFGEAFYSPRVYEYAAAIAPQGQEASYGALSYVPFLLAKLLIGSFSGILLTRYCPAEGPRYPQTMWLLVACTSLIAPVGLLVCWRFIRVREAGRA